MSKDPATTECRRQAEALLLQRQAGTSPPSEGDVHKLLHELQVHQIELEMQNQALEQANETARSALDRYAELYDFAPIGYFTLDPVGVIAQGNLAGAALLHTERGRLVGQRLGNFLTSEGRGRFADFLDHLFAVATSSQCELALEGGGWIRIAGQVEGSGRHCRTVVQEITAERQASLALAAEQTRLRTLIRTIPDLVWLKDTHGVYLDCNPAFERFFGAPAAQIVGKTDADFVDAHLAETFRQKDLDVMLAEEPCRLEEWITLADSGAHVLVETIKTPMLDSDGQIFGVLGIARDITERFETQQKLEQQLRQIEVAALEWREVFDALPDPIFLHDRDLKIVRANHAYTERAGRPFEQIMGQPYWQIFPATTAPSDHCLNLVEKQTQIETPDGAIFDSRSFPVSDAQGQYLFSVHILEEITERIRKEHILARTTHALRTLSASNRSLIHTHDENQLLDAMCRAAVKEGGYRMAWVGIVGGKGQPWPVPVAHAGISPDDLTALERGLMEGRRDDRPAMKALATGKTQIEHNVPTEASSPQARQEAIRLGYAACIALPLANDALPFGVLTLYSQQAAPFGPEEVALLEEMAGDMAFGIVNLHTSQQRDQALLDNQRYLSQIQANLESTIQAISMTVEMRDPYTAGHQRRVTALACAIAADLELEPEQIHGLRIGAVIHDLGKIQIPAEILSKPGKLTELERSLIQQHAQIGYNILKGIDFPWPVADMVLQHHERLDGSGYPNGLKGNLILLEARIIAVADIVEAMASHRPYRPSLGIEAALEEIARQREDGLLDPTVVDVCLTLFHDKGFVLGD